MATFILKDIHQEHKGEDSTDAKIQGDLSKFIQIQKVNR